MPDFKILGSNNLTSNETAGVMTQGLGFPLRTVDVSPSPERTLTAFDDTIQQPSALNTPLQIKWGAAQGTANDPVQLLADGTIQINQSGFYAFLTTLKCGRQGGSGGIALIFLRALIDGVQIGRPVALEIDNNNIVIPEQFEFALFLNAGQTVTAELYRDSGGQNDGGLFPTLSALGWGTSPSARLRVYKT